MIISSALFFLVAGTISVVTSANITYIKDASTGQLDLEYGQKCVREGRMCEDCQKVVYCINMGNGTFQKEDLYDCSRDETCLNTINACSMEPNPICDDLVTKNKFICHHAGTFPDAKDCTKYHVCLTQENGESVNPKPYSGQCGAGFSYDPRTTLCRNKIAPGTECEQFAPAGCIAGETGAIPNSPNYYYICLPPNGSGRYFPQMFVCPENMEFFEGRCVDPFPVPPFDENGMCKAEGIFVHKTSCLHFYSCSAVNAQPIAGQCPAGKRFDDKTLTCVPITCSNL